MLKRLFSTRAIIIAGIICAVAILAIIVSYFINRDSGDVGSQATDLTVGDVKILSNGTYYEPFKRMAHAGSAGLSASGEPVDIDRVANDLVPIHIGDDFQIIVEGKSDTSRRYNVRRFVDGSWVRKLLVPDGSNYTLMEPIDDSYSEMFYTGSFIDFLESGENIISFEERWGTRDEYIIYEYFFKIIID